MKQKYWNFRNLKIDRVLHIKGDPWVKASFHYLNSDKELTADEIVEELKDKIDYTCGDEEESNEELIRDAFNYDYIQQISNVLLVLENGDRDGVAWSYEELKELDDYLQYGVVKDFYLEEDDE